MRVSLESKIKYLANVGAMYEIGLDRVSGKYILIVISGPIEGSVFLSKNISTIITKFYNQCINNCKCDKNSACNYCPNMN